jgi:Uma2 family endonuclease
MSTATARKLLTEAEYLEIERAAEFKSEYFQGEMFAMSGARESHVQVSCNLLVELTLGLRGRPCAVYSSDMRVQVKSIGLYTYPDISIACGERRFRDDRRDTLLNPVVLIEVLSPSTEGYDRGAKFELYKNLESLREYVLGAQDRTHVEIYTRDENPNRWRCTVHEEMDAVVVFESVGCRVSLAEIYRDVEFAPMAGEGETDAA